jgi:cell division protein FtsB
MPCSGGRQFVEEDRTMHFQGTKLRSAVVVFMGTLALMGGVGSRVCAQVASPEQNSAKAQPPAPASAEARELESLRREVTELKELVRKLQQNLEARDEGQVRPTVDLNWLPVAPRAMPHVLAPRHSIMEEPRGHLRFPIQIERANFPSPVRRIDDAVPQGSSRIVPKIK